MSCETCQDCGCENITLPVITGPTGATGATGTSGSNGTNGTDGVVVLHNDVVQSTTASTSEALFSATKEYSMPAGTLSTNGSKLLLTALFSTTGLTFVESAGARIFIGGSNFTANNQVYTISNAGSDYQMYLKIQLEITRVSNTVLFINSNSVISNGGTLQDVASYHFLDTSTVVSDIDINPLVFQLKGIVSNVEVTFNCDQLTIDHLIK